MIQWIQENGPALLGIWAAIGFLCDAIAAMVPPGRAKGALLFIGHVSPGALVSAFKAGRAVLAGVGVAALVALALGCSATTEAAIVKDDVAAVPYTNTFCSFLDTASGENPVVTLSCAAVESGEQIVAQLPVPDAGATAPAITAALPQGGSMIVKVPAEKLPAFLAKVKIVAPPAPAGVPAAKAVVQAVTAPAPAPAPAPVDAGSGG